MVLLPDGDKSSRQDVVDDGDEPPPRRSESIAPPPYDHTEEENTRSHADNKQSFSSPPEDEEPSVPEATNRAMDRWPAPPGRISSQPPVDLWPAPPKRLSTHPPVRSTSPAQLQTSGSANDLYAADDDGDSSIEAPETDAPLGSADDPSELPASTAPTIALLIPFPAAERRADSSGKKDKIPPFVLYAPLAPALTKPVEGQKENLVTKAKRKWQTEEREAKEPGKTGLKAKAVKLISKGMSATKNSNIEFLVRTPNKKKLKELRIIYPASYTAEDIKNIFADLVRRAKSGAIWNGIISTAMLPFVAAFDMLTFVPGPFEINAVWAASSWTGAARASSITSRITSDKLPIAFGADARLDALAYRLHEFCWRKAKRRGTVGAPRWSAHAAGGASDEKSGKARAAPPVSPGSSAEGGKAYAPPPTPKRGPELATVVLEVLMAYGEDMTGVEQDKRLVGEDLERCLKKGAKEWLAAVE